ncbi:MAG: hypothetical protein RL344_530 [Pseudomonadota bacterium]|jgi:rhamnosyltransferase
MNNTQKKIAVLLAAYNGTEWLQEQIDSILNQVNVNITIFISIDESTDNTLEKCILLSKKYNNIVILPSIGRMGSASKNFFRLVRDVDLIQFDYVAFADQDDIWNQDKLFRAVTQLKNTNADAYSSNVTAFWENGKQCLINKAQSQVKYDYMFESAGPGCTFVLTKKIALKLQKFLIINQLSCDKISMHDWFIYAFLRSHNYQWFIDNHSSMLYRQHNNNVIGANIGLKTALIRWKKLRQGWLVEQSILIADVVGYSDKPPIIWLKRLNILDRIKLIKNIFSYRRRFREKIILALFFMIYTVPKQEKIIF